MLYFKNTILGTVLLSAALTVATVNAEELSAEQSSEMTTIEQQLKAYAIVGQRQLVYLTEQATQEYSDTLADSQPNLPAAWMLMNDGTTIKRIDIDEQADGAPAQLRILMYRAALKSVARGNEINAAAILYTGKIRKDSDKKALVIEHEHRLGISANKIIPYEVKDGNVFYGKAVTSEKPFQLFYDSREDAQASQK